ncbi:MAG: molybdenum cofactor guanylyltransferase MobA [Alphaproteobacteria bacterium]|nr:molybdenum cofactor guanylyltransferase MobA [Alphaproteobacteria bacterium]
MAVAEANPSVAGVLLAGGLARRMGGGDKCLRQLGGKTLLEHVIGRVRPQVGALLLNANGDPARLARFALPVAADVVEGNAGPLAGVLTGMEWAVEEAQACSWLASFATDAPFLPEDLVARLMRAVQEEGADMACASSGGRAHPVFALWPLRLRDDLRRAVMEEGLRKVDVWTGRYNLAMTDFPVMPFDPFFNANSPEDLEAAASLMA